MKPVYLKAIWRLVNSLEAHDIPDDLGVEILNAAADDVRRCWEYREGLIPSETF